MPRSSMPRKLVEIEAAAERAERRRARHSGCCRFCRSHGSVEQNSSSSARPCRAGSCACAAGAKHQKRQQRRDQRHDGHRWPFHCEALLRTKSGAPEGIRTPDPQIRSLVLYPAELPAREFILIAVRRDQATDTLRTGAITTSVSGSASPRKKALAFATARAMTPEKLSSVAPARCDVTTVLSNSSNGAADRRLARKGVDAGPEQVPVFQRRRQCGFIDQAAARAIDQHGAGFHGANALRADDAGRLRQQRQVQRNNVGGSQQLVEIGVR